LKTHFKILRKRTKNAQKRIEKVYENASI